MKEITFDELKKADADRRFCRHDIHIVKGTGGRILGCRLCGKMGLAVFGEGNINLFHEDEIETFPR